MTPIISDAKAKTSRKDGNNSYHPNFFTMGTSTEENKMTDIEILKSMRINEWLDTRLGEAGFSILLRAMAQARADERVQVGRDINIATINGDLPDICECVADFVVSGK